MEQAIASDSKYILAYTALGDVYCLKLGQCEKAATLLAQAVTLQPTAVAPRIGLGRAHLRLGRYEEAAASFEAAIAADSTAAAAFNWLGVARTRLGQYELAAQALRRAIHLDMLNPQAYYNLSQTYQKQGKTKESDVALRAFNRIDAHSGDILRWKTVLDGNPHDAMALFELGRIYARLGVASEAAASFQRALAINPSHAPTWHNLGNAYARLDRLDEAIAAFRQALALDEEYALAWYNLGNAHFAKGELAQARKAFTTALDHREGVRGRLPRPRGSGAARRGSRGGIGPLSHGPSSRFELCPRPLRLGLGLPGARRLTARCAGAGALQAAARWTVTCDPYWAWLSSHCLAPQSRRCPIRPLARSAWPLAWQRSRKI